MVKTKRMIRALFTSLMLTSILVFPALAQPRQSLSLTNVQSSEVQYDYAVEKQVWTHVDGTKYHLVVNPTACTWDINDHSEYSTRGDVAAGSSTSTTLCHIASAEPLYACYSDYCTWWSGRDNWIGLRMYAKTADVKASLCFSPGRCFDAIQTYDSKNHKWISNFCVTAVYQGNPYDPLMADIAGSNGGIGVQEDITFNVKGTQTKGIVQDVYVNWGVSSDIFYPLACQFGQGANGWPINPYQVPQQSEYPFIWTK